jgi:hypothetical protein
MALPPQDLLQDRLADYHLAIRSSGAKEPGDHVTLKA